MLKTITLKCSNCGGNLEITPEMDNFACGYCGASQIVQRRGGTISLKLLTDSISKVQIGTDKTAAELAIKRLTGEIADAKRNYNQMENAKGKEIKSNAQIFLALGIIGPIILWAFLANLSSILAVIVVLLGVAGAFYLFRKRYETIKANYDPKLERLDDQYYVLRKKLKRQKAIVDS